MLKMINMLSERGVYLQYTHKTAQRGIRRKNNLVQDSLPISAPMF